MKIPHCLVFLLGLPLLAWGDRGHLVAAEGALRTLPPHLRAWYLERESRYTQASLEPDRWKQQDPEETARHRIFCEAYGGAAMVPAQEAVARSQVSPWTFVSSGQLPWVIAGRYRGLVQAFQSGDSTAVVEASGWLCHYIADAQVPLHTTRNHNGKLTAQKGVHRRWETDLLGQDGAVELLGLRAAAAPAHLPRTIASWIRHSHALVVPLLAADRAASSLGPNGNSLPAAALWKDQKGVVIEQLRHSAQATGDLLLAAWIEAGKPLRP